MLCCNMWTSMIFMVISLSYIQSFLKTITNRSEYFGYNELSFYSWSPVCVQDLFGYRESLRIYKISYIVALLAVLVAIASFYMVILYIFSKSRKVINPTNESNPGGDPYSNHHRQRSALSSLAGADRDSRRCAEGAPFSTSC